MSERIDITLSPELPKELLHDKHKSFLVEFSNKDENDYEYIMTEYLRMSGVYWGLTALDLMHSLDLIDKEKVVAFIKSCQGECGGFSPSNNHDPHILYTLSALQLLVLFHSVDAVNVDAIVEFVVGLQQPDGSFWGDKWGETDTRFSFCATASLALIDRLDKINKETAIDFILSSRNFDGGFGVMPDSETHSGQVYCCVGALSILGALDRLDADSLGFWLCERQLPSGGLNGRPEKLPDVCYSWWVLASMQIIGRLHWIDKPKLRRFILACQDEETGGFADRPGDMVDPFHTLFGLAGLSLLGEETLKQINPVFCMSEELIRSRNIKLQYISSTEND